MIDSELLLQQLWAVSHANTLLLGGIFFIGLGLLRAVSSRSKEQFLCGAGCLIVMAIASLCVLLPETSAASPGALFVSDSVTRGGAKLALFGGMLLVLLGWDQVKPGYAADHYGCLLMMLSGLIYTSQDQAYI